MRGSHDNDLEKDDKIIQIQTLVEYMKQLHLDLCMFKISNFLFYIHKVNEINKVVSNKIFTKCFNKKR